MTTVTPAPWIIYEADVSTPEGLQDVLSHIAAILATGTGKMHFITYESVEANKIHYVGMTFGGPCAADNARLMVVGRELLREQEEG